jgi:hypothetical protein
MSERIQQLARLLLIATIVGLFCFAEAEAKKPPKPPVGPEYLISPFSPPGVESRASNVTDLNEQGCAVGFVEPVEGGYVGYHLDIATGVYTMLPGGSGGLGLNNHNQIVGTLLDETGDHGLFWASPTAAPEVLPLLPGDARGYANSLNDEGIAVGGSMPARTGVAWRIVVDDSDGVSIAQPIPLFALSGDVHSFAADVNEMVDGSAQVTGMSYDAEGLYRAVRWTITVGENGLLSASAPESVGTLGLLEPTSSDARAINNWGDVCGSSDRMPYVAPSGGSPAELPVIRNTQWGTAIDVNDFGDIVGQLDVYKLQGYIAGPMAYRAYLWKDGEATDLETLIDDDGWGQLWAGKLINNQGVIAGYGRYDVDSRGFIMVPITP